MATSVCKCYNRGYKFNYTYIFSVSFYSLRVGGKRIFHCPKCKTLQKFDLFKKGPDDTLKVYKDSAEIGVGVKIWALMLVPTLAFIFLGDLFLITFLNTSFFVFSSVFLRQRLFGAQFT